MADKSFLSSLEDYLSCPVCFEVFTDPVTIKCNHNVCKACLTQHWKSKGSQDCPVCRRKSSMTDPSVNFTLQKIAESFRKEQHSKRCETSAGAACDVHGGKLKLFCLNEGETFCEDCTSEHEDHKHVSVQEAVKGYKKDIETALEPMNLKIQKYQAFKTQCVNLEDHIQKQAQQTERHIKEEFEKLHQFLRDEEKARIAALRGEEEQKRRIMKEKIEHISKIISSMSETMTAIDHEMKTEDLVFLKTYRKTKKRAKWTLEDPQCVSGALIDVAEHLGSLKYKVWEKMLGIVQYTPVTLDPNTAAPWLVLSEDLTSDRQ